jgi:hypothetical protein
LTSLSKPATKSAKRVKLHPSLQLTLVLFAFMLTIGIVSGIVGYTLGRESLREVTQPAINPFLKDEPDSIKQRPRQGVNFLPEKEIIAKVKAQTKGPSKPNENQSKQKPEKSKAKSTQSPPPKAKPELVSPRSFPIKVEEQAVQFEVRSATQTEDRLLLNVALKNNGAKPIQFIYTFLDIEDDQGQPLFAEVQGLPTELKPKSDNYFGTIQVLDVPPETVKQVSLTLTDYPDQTVTIKVANIPVSN